MFLVAFVCCPLVFEFSIGIGGFVIGPGQISFFFSVRLASTIVNNQLILYFPDFGNNLGQMYLAEVEIKDTTASNISASDLDLLL